MQKNQDHDAAGSQAAQHFQSRWYTLLRFCGEPRNLTAVAQAKSASEAHLLQMTWTQTFRDETTLVFDPDNAPVTQMELLRHIVHAEQKAGQNVHTPTVASISASQPHRRVVR